MLNNRPDQRQQPNGRKAREEQYELAYFAQKHAISASKAKEILDRSGSSREAADMLAARGKPSY